MARVSHGPDRLRVVFDDPNLVAKAGLILIATRTARLGLEALVGATRPAWLLTPSARTASTDITPWSNSPSAT